jgi:hypothetical protein
MTSDGRVDRRKRIDMKDGWQSKNYVGKPSFLTFVKFEIGNNTQRRQAGRNLMRSIAAMKNTNKFLEVLYSYRIPKYFVYQLLRSRAKDLAKSLSPYLSKDDLILDIGSDSCTVPEILMEQDLKVLPLDIQNYSIVDAISPTIYDGSRMPFKDNQFDVSLILFVLHHSYDPTKLLVEAKRVSRKILIFEDIITSSAHGYLTAALDSLMNLEFFNQPHSNKRDNEWQTLFDDLGLKVLNREYNNYGVVIKHALYLLEK